MSDSERRSSLDLTIASLPHGYYYESGYIPTSYAEGRGSLNPGAQNTLQEHYDASQPHGGSAQSHERSDTSFHDSLTTLHDSAPQGDVAAHGPPQSTEYTALSQTEAERKQAAAPPTSSPSSEASWFAKLNRGWVPEIVSEVFSFVFLVALIILLSRLSDRPLSTWTIEVSPNAVIAILSIASKALFIYALGQTISQLKWLHLLREPDSLHILQHYDDASRGPLGAFRLFWNVRSASFFAYLGCLTIVLALAFEAFSQQLLDFDEREVADPSKNSSVSFSTVYDFKGVGIDGSGVIVGSRDNPMRAAIVNGIYDVVKMPPFKCPGARCTYPDFTAFGVCSECADVTSTIEIQLLVDTWEHVWSIRTPGNLTLQATAGVDAHNGFFHTLANSTAVNLNVLFGGLGMPMRTAIIRFPEDKLSSETTTSNFIDAIEAYECTLSFCGRQFVNWESNNGTLSGEEHVIKLNNSDVAVQNDPVLRILKPLNASESLNTTDGKNEFVINYEDGENMVKILSSIFNVQGPLLEINADVTPTALYGSANIEATIGNIAKGMTYRMMSGPNATTIFGDVYGTKTFMRVHWPWITLPAVLSVTSLVCLVGCILMTRRARQVIWKSSLMPLLLPGGANECDDGEALSRTRTITRHLTM